MVGCIRMCVFVYTVCVYREGQYDSNFDKKFWGLQGLVHVIAKLDKLV